MPFRDDNPEPPRAETIPLTPENEALRVELLQGIEAAITSEVAHTFENTDTSDRQAVFALPNPKYLSRAAIFKLDGMPNSPDEDVASKEPVFQVAVEIRTHQLDKEKATDITPEKAAELGFVWPDSLSIQLIEHTSGNLSRWSFCYQPRQIPSGFDLNGSKRGFKNTVPARSANPILEAAGITVPESFTEVVGVNQDGLDGVGEFRAINETLNRGSADMVATQRLVGILSARETTELLTVDTQVMRNSMPHFRNLIAQALASPSFRDMIAWQQYWEQRTAMGS